MLENKNYDVIVIGGGIAGYESARALARGGKSVALIEKDILGGTALRWGALPIKKILDAFKNIKKYDHYQVIENTENIILKLDFLLNWNKSLNELDNKIKTGLLDLDVDIYFGDGKFIDSNTFKVGDELLKAKYFIIATGTEPSSIEDIPIDYKMIITHKKVIDLSEIPKSIIVLGGNVEGIEIAAIYAEMGVDVTIIEKENNILIGNDQDLIGPIEENLKSKNVNIIRGIGAKAGKIYGDKVMITLEDGKEILAEKAVVTFIRKPNFPRGIENTKIKFDNNRIIVNDNLETDEKNIFAIGDINGILGMAHVAIQQGLQVADYIIKDKPIELSYEILSRAVFTLPEMAGVGKQEWELKQDRTPYKVGKVDLANTWRGWSKDITDGFVKVLLDENNIFLGIWMVGENVSEYIGLMGMLIKENKTADDILSNLIIHPSLTEAISEAISQVKDKEVIR